MPASERKRPWYLVLALFAALLFGAIGARNGWNTVTLYREPVDPTMAGAGIADEADRAAVIARVEAYVVAFDAAKARGWPLGIAGLLLGGATLFFAMRAMGGSRAARSAVLQLVLAQAGVSAASHWLLRDVEAAEVPMLEARQAAEFHESIPDRARADELSRRTGAVLHAAPPITLALQIFGSALIVLALTRRRALDFFEATAATVGER
jgi:hypothetical protein